MKNNKIYKIQEMLMKEMERLDNNGIMEENASQEISRSKALTGTASTYLSAINLSMKIVETAEKNSISVDDIQDFLESKMNSSMFNREEKEYLEKNIKGKFIQDFLPEFNKKFNRNITYSQLRGYMSEHRISSGVRKAFNKEEEKYIKENIKGRYVKDFVKDFNKKFNRNISVKKMQKYKANHHIRSECPAKIGEIAKMRTIPIGTIVDWNKGYLYIKVALPSVWEPYSVYLYKKYIGEVPNGMTVAFLDGNKRNFELSNLYLARGKDILLAGSLGFISKDKELTKTGIMLAKLINKTTLAKKGK